MNQAHSGWHGIPWHRCDRCGIEFPVSYLRRQRGLILCVVNNCWDDPLIWNRPGLIQNNLAWGAEYEMQVADILTQDMNEDMEDEWI